VNISRIPPSSSLRPSKSILIKSKFYLKNQSFVQATRENIEDILKIKEAFSKLSPSKITEIQNITNNNEKTKDKLRINQRAI